VEFWENPEIKDKELLVPVYDKNTSKFMIELSEPIPFEMSESNYNSFKRYVDSCPKEVFIVAHEFGVDVYKKLTTSILAKPEKYISLKEETNYKSLEVLLDRLKEYIGTKYQELTGFENVRNKIVHFRKIKVKENMKKKLVEIAKEIKNINVLSDEEIEEKIKKGEISIKEGLRIKGEQSKLEQELNGIKLKKLVQHYYIPLAFLKDPKQKVDWIKNIITTESEICFLNALVNHMNKVSEKVDWWLFSKINEHYDQVYIPYYTNGKIKRFIPDFVFWIKKGEDYKIVFVDPKGKEHIEWLEKLINGYGILFRENGKYDQPPKVFREKGKSIKVELFFFTPTQKPSILREYWLDKSEIERIFQ
jgi:hypothetical protein